MNRFAKITLILGTAFGIPMGALAGIVIGLVLGFSSGVWFGLATAAVSGLAFGLSMAGVAAIQRRRFSQTRPEFVGEPLLHDGPANHLLRWEGVGGWLYLTEQRLFFRSHDFNIQSHDLSVPLAEISEVSPVQTFKIISNGLRVVTLSGRDERFVVEAHKRWCDEVLRAKSRLTQT
jgi:hypothetical protein